MPGETGEAEVQGADRAPVVNGNADTLGRGGKSDGNTAFLRAARAGNLEKVLEYLKSNIDINTSNANGLNALHLASKDGHVNVVTELLKRGATVDAATKKGNTALHIASLAGQEEVVKILVSHGASVNVQSQNGFTPLYMAAQENHDNVVRFLLANGANQSLATEDGFTPLAVAMQQGHDKVVAVLLENDTRGKVRLPALHIAAKKDDCKAAALLLQNDHNPDVTSKSGFTPLHIAAHYGNDNIANLLLQRGADVNYSAKHNITPLHVAAKWGKTNMVSLLIEKGANIEAKTRDGLTPLHCAARSGHEQVVDMLLERGAPISSKTKNGLAPLHMASQGDHVDAARILLYHKAPVDEVTVDYLTALHVAAHCGHVRVAKLLLDRKADPNARALNGFTPLHIACKKNRIKVVELLLKHGASIEATTESGLTPLHVASFMGCMNIVIYLIQHGANPDVPTVRGETPLHLAARANQTDIIRILLRNGAQVDARAREQQTPLHIASRLGNVDIVMLLLQHGAAVDETTKDMYTALHIAAKEGQEEVASVLLEHGASLNATTKKGFTPLHLAAKYGNMKVARLLLQRDAPVDTQGKNGVTPLHVASHYDHQNVALLLLDKGASPHATAKNGHTPLHIAARKNQMDIATTLLEYGAKANAESKAGFTPLHLSAQEGHTDMSTLLIEHQADPNHKAKNGLTPLHLCAQEDRVNVAAILVKNGAEVDAKTKAGYTPLHVACHFGQINMVRFLLQHGVDVNSSTSVGYTPLHQAAQQGHVLIINLLLEHKASPNAVTSQGQTALSIAQKLGYISVVETLKVVTETVITTTTTTITEEKYKVVAPESMQETFMSDSEDEGGEDTMLSDQPYRYLTVDEMKSLGDDSLPIDVTRDERGDSNRDSMAPPTAVEDTISPQHTKDNYNQFTNNYAPDNVDIARHPVHVGFKNGRDKTQKSQVINFLVSFMVDARGGAMRGCRHSGVRVIIPPRKASMPMRVTCRYLKKDKLTHPPPLMEGEALASRILELGPVGAKFLGPVIIEVPHFGSLRGKEREIVILRSDNGETWREHTLEASEEAIQEVLNESFDGEDLNQLEDLNTNRITRILTNDFPQYFAIVSRIRQEVHAIGPEGGMVSSTVVPQVQAVFPQGALTKKIKVGLQAQPIATELVAKLLGNRVAVSPIVTVEPRRRKFHKPITLTIPVPQAANKGMINQYSGDAPTLRLLCSITGVFRKRSLKGGTTRAQWEDVTGSTPLTFVNDCVSFTTTVSARFWLMDCRNIGEATKMATELYKEAIHVPFMAKFVVFAKRVDVLEARLRVFCMTDDKEDKTLEHQEHFTEVAKSRDVEVLEGKAQFVEFAGNLVPVTKSGDQLQLGFHAFKENRLPFTVRVKDPHADTVGRILFMREPKVAKGEPPQSPICILNIVLPETIMPESAPSEPDLLELGKKYSFLRDGGRPEMIHRADLRLSDICNLLDSDWVQLANELDIATSDINLIKSEYPDSIPQQAMVMLRLWMQQAGNKATGNTLEKALRRINREDIVNQCIFNVEPVTDDVEKALAKVQLDQSGFDTFKEELGPSRDTSLRRNASLDATYDEQDMMKESESVEELVQAEKIVPISPEKEKIRRESPEEYETKDKETEKEIIKEETKVSIKKKDSVKEYESEEKKYIGEEKDYEVFEEFLAMKEKQAKEEDIIKVIIDEAEMIESPKRSPLPSQTDEEKEEAQQRKSDLQEISDELVRHDPGITVTVKSEHIIDKEELSSPKVSKTPPPSPAEFREGTVLGLKDNQEFPAGKTIVHEDQTEYITPDGTTVRQTTVTTTTSLVQGADTSGEEAALLAESETWRSDDLDLSARPEDLSSVPERTERSTFHVKESYSHHKPTEEGESRLTEQDDRLVQQQKSQVEHQITKTVPLKPYTLPPSVEVHGPDVKPQPSKPPRDRAPLSFKSETRDEFVSRLQTSPLEDVKPGIEQDVSPVCPSEHLVPDIQVKVGISPSDSATGDLQEKQEGSIEENIQSYSDRKKFWEQMTKSSDTQKGEPPATRKTVTAIQKEEAMKVTSVTTVITSPTLAPRSATTTQIPATSVSEAPPAIIKSETESDTDTTFSDSTIRMCLTADTKQSSITISDVSDREEGSSEHEADTVESPKPSTATTTSGKPMVSTAFSRDSQISLTESSDSEAEYVSKRSTPLAFDNTAFAGVEKIDITPEKDIEESEKLEEPSEVPKIVDKKKLFEQKAKESHHERPSVTQIKRIYERSVSLPAEELDVGFSGSVKAKKKFFEAQIKKEMVVEQLMQQPEEASPEHKAIHPGDSHDRSIDQETLVSHQIKTQIFSHELDEKIEFLVPEEKYIHPKQVKLQKEELKTETTHKGEEYVEKGVEEAAKEKEQWEEEADVEHGRVEIIEKSESEQFPVDETYEKGVVEASQEKLTETDRDLYKAYPAEVVEDLEDEQEQRVDHFTEPTELPEDKLKGTYKEDITDHVEKYEKASQQIPEVKMEEMIDIVESGEELGIGAVEVLQYKTEAITKPSDSLEVHVDKSEIEGTEKEKDIDEDIKDLEHAKVMKETTDISEHEVDSEGKQSFHISEEHLPDTVWEVPVQEQPDSVAAEVVQDIPIGKQVIVEKEEEEEDSSKEAEKKPQMSEEEARKIAEEVVETIEVEVAKRTSLVPEVEEAAPSSESEVTTTETKITEYLKELSGRDDLNEEELKLLESVMAKKQQQLRMKFSRTDTSSIEITDEDLRSSGAEADLSPVESQAEKLSTMTEEDTVKKALAEVRESLEAAQEELIEEHKKKDDTVQKKRSPSEFEFKVLAFDHVEKKIEESIEESKHEEAKASAEYVDVSSAGKHFTGKLDVMLEEKETIKDSTKETVKEEKEIKGKLDISKSEDKAMDLVQKDTVSVETEEHKVKSRETEATEKHVSDADDKSAHKEETALAKFTEKEETLKGKKMTETETRTSDTVQKEIQKEETEELDVATEETYVAERKEEIHVEDEDSIKSKTQETKVMEKKLSKTEEKQLKTEVMQETISKTKFDDEYQEDRICHEQLKTEAVSSTQIEKTEAQKVTESTVITAQKPYFDKSSAIATIKDEDSLQSFEQETRTSIHTSEQKTQKEVTTERKVEVQEKVYELDSSLMEEFAGSLPPHSDIPPEGIILKETVQETKEVKQEKKEIKKEGVQRTSSDESQKSTSQDEMKSPEESLIAPDKHESEPDTVRVERPDGTEAIVVLRRPRHAYDRKSDAESSSSGSRDDRSTLRADRRSGADFEAWSSSGESHYHSFEQTSDSGRTASRPCSSDVEALMAGGSGTAGSSEYESALTSQDYSTRSTTSQDYNTAVSSLSSRESMKSLDSESSGHLASLEISSETSETLVPSALELERDMEGTVETPVMEDDHDLSFPKQSDDIVREPYDNEIPPHVLRGESPPKHEYDQDIQARMQTEERYASPPDYLPLAQGGDTDRSDEVLSPFEVISESEVAECHGEVSESEGGPDEETALFDQDAVDSFDVSGAADRPRMKRSIEMTFHPEPRPIMTGSPPSESPQSQVESQGLLDTIEDVSEKFGSSLEDGILSVSLSSISEAAMRTVIETAPQDQSSRTDSDKMDASATSEQLSALTVSGTSEQLSLSSESRDDVETTAEPATSSQPMTAESGTSTYPPSPLYGEPRSVTITTSSVEDHGIQSVCTQVTSESHSQIPSDEQSSDDDKKPGYAHSNGPMEVEYMPEYDDFEDTQKRHHRTESTISSAIHISKSHGPEEKLATFAMSRERTESDDASGVEEMAESDKYRRPESLTLKEGRDDEKKDIDESELKEAERLEESYQTEADQAFHRDLREGRLHDDAQPVIFEGEETSLHEPEEEDLDQPEAELKELESRPQSTAESQVSKSDSESQRPFSSEMGFSDDRPDSELTELLKQCSDGSKDMEDPIERPHTPEPVDDYEIKDDTPEFSSEAQASVTELEMEYSGAFSRTAEYASHVSPIREEKTMHIDMALEDDIADSLKEEKEEEMAEAEAAFYMVPHTPTLPTAIPPTIPEEDSAEKHELEVSERSPKDKISKDVPSPYDTSDIPDITVTQHMTPLLDKGFTYPDLELEAAEAKSSPQTPASVSSHGSEKSSETETDQGREYILEDEDLGDTIPEEPEFEAHEQLQDESTTEEFISQKSVCETKDLHLSDERTASTEKEVIQSESVESDSFEMIEKSELEVTDEYVIVEEVAREADDSGAAAKIIEEASDAVEDLLVSSPPPPATKMTGIKYYPDVPEVEEGPFLFEPDSPPKDTVMKSVGVRTHPKTDTKDDDMSPTYAYEMSFERAGFVEEAEFERDVEAGKKWIEMQFQGEGGNFGYEMGFEHGSEEHYHQPLEDIEERREEEELNDIEPPSSKVGSLGSCKESLSSTPEYDVLAGRKFFTRSGENDDVSMSSLQEFERLEKEIALETARRQSLGSQDSLNGKKCQSRSGQGDDVSLSSLQEFERLESACIEAEKIEKRAREEEAMLSEIEEGHESQVSESESCETLSEGGKESDSDDYEKRMFEIDEIIRQAQSNVEQFEKEEVLPMDELVPVRRGSAGSFEGTESSMLDKTESIGREDGDADSLEEAQVPELDLDQPYAQQVEQALYDKGQAEAASVVQHAMAARTTSGGSVQSAGQSSTATQFDIESLRERQGEDEEDSLMEDHGVHVETSSSAMADIMQASTDSLELKTAKSLQDPMQTSTDSLELRTGTKSGDAMTTSADSIEFQGPHDAMTTSVDSIEGAIGGASDVMAGSSDSMELQARLMTTSTDSLELGTATAKDAMSRSADSIEEESPPQGQGADSDSLHGAQVHDQSSSSGREGDLSSSGKEDSADREIPRDLMMCSTDSLEPSSSTATHATYQYETDSVMSSSFTSGGSATMVSSTDTLDPDARPSPSGSSRYDDVRQIFVDQGAAASLPGLFDPEGNFPDSQTFTDPDGNIRTVIHCDKSDDSSEATMGAHGGQPYVTEVIEPAEEGDTEFSHTVHRTVEMPAEIQRVTFHGPDAEQQLQEYIDRFGPGEDVRESEEVDEDGNIHIKRVIQKRVVVRPETVQISGPNAQERLEEYLRQVAKEQSKDHAEEETFEEEMEDGSIRRVTRKKITKCIMHKADSSEHGAESGGVSEEDYQHLMTSIAGPDAYQGLPDPSSQFSQPTHKTFITHHTTNLPSCHDSSSIQFDQSGVVSRTQPGLTSHLAGESGCDPLMEEGSSLGAPFRGSEFFPSDDPAAFEQFAREFGGDPPSVQRRVVTTHTHTTTTIGEGGQPVTVTTTETEVAGDNQETPDILEQFITDERHQKQKDQQK